MEIRPPIVVILGHVDHGKTTLLSYIRKSRMPKEAGEITQHIGAYQAEVHSDQGVANSGKITFLDTPGHEAFTAIRSRGAQVADVAVLVVAAEESVKPQTKEAIKIIKESKIPFVVAINKIDKEGANPQKVRQELAENDVMVEGYGGQVPVVEISAKTGKGIDHLLETILLIAELEELKTSPENPLSGVVIESHLDSRRGTVATLLIHDGQLRVGDWLTAGSAVARVKMLQDFSGNSIKSAGASEPCVVLGWENIPVLGAKVSGAKDQSEAQKKVAEEARRAPALFSGNGVPRPKVANLIIKADVQSSLEAIDQILRTIHSSEVGYKVVGHGVGNINDGDIKSAAAAHAAVIGFHVGTEPSAKRAAEREKVRVETFEIIYELVELVRGIMSDLLEPEIKRGTLGKLKILALFGTQGKTQIVGGKVTQGKAVRGALVEIMRSNNLFAKGKIVQLQHKKADVSEVVEGLECGLRVDVAPSELGVPLIIKEGDMLEIYEEQKIKRSLA